MISLYWTLTKTWQKNWLLKHKPLLFHFQHQKVDGAYLGDGQLYFRGEVVMAASEIGVPGSHNENALATIAVAKLRGVDNQTIKETYQPLEVSNTVSNLNEIRGVKFYNDSKSTNILATQKPCQDLTIVRLS